jgi:hypothetical protein
MLGCSTDHPKYAVSMGEDFMPFPRIIVPSFSSTKQPRIYESSATVARTWHLTLFLFLLG